MSGLIDFLLARLTDDERLARNGLHSWDCAELDSRNDDDSWCTCDYGAHAMAEVQVKRAIVDTHDGWHVCPYADPVRGRGHTDFTNDVDDLDMGMEICPTLRLLASVYADHPDYRAEDWTP